MGVEMCGSAEWELPMNTRRLSANHLWLIKYSGLSAKQS